jgi:hypothetical protein
MLFSLICGNKIFFLIANPSLLFFQAKEPEQSGLYSHISGTRHAGWAFG